MDTEHAEINIEDTYTCSWICSKRVSSPSEETLESVRCVMSELSEVDLRKAGGLAVLDLMRCNCEFVGKLPTVACASSDSFVGSPCSPAADGPCCAIVTFCDVVADAEPKVDRLGELADCPASLGASREDEKGDVILKPFGKDGNQESGPDHERLRPKKPLCNMAFVLLDL